MKKNEVANEYERFLLKKQLDVLKDKHGFHTALITLFIPPERKIHQVTTYLSNEISESTNIKSKTNRKNVLDSITAILGRLKLYNNPPENGLIIYSGQIPEDGKPGTEKGEIYIIEPPEKVGHFKYHCAANFLVDPLYDMIQEKGSFGIINIENKEAAVGYVRGARLEVLKTMISGIHSKHSAGGQSQRRLERLIEEGAQNFYLRVAEYANLVFLQMEDLEGIFMSGGGMAKQKFIDKGALDYRLSDKVVDFVDTAYSGEAGIRETVMKIGDKIANLKYIREKKIYTRFLDSISKDDGKTTYGEKAVRKVLKAGAVDTLLLGEKLDLRRITIKCGATKCNYEISKTIKPKQLKGIVTKLSSSHCPKCNSSNLNIDKNLDLMEEIGGLARESGAKIQVLSELTEEGSALMHTFGGIAAILRWRQM